MVQNLKKYIKITECTDAFRWSTPEFISNSLKGFKLTLKSMKFSFKDLTLKSMLI